MDVLGSIRKTIANHLFGTVGRTMTTRTVGTFLIYRPYLVLFLISEHRRVQLELSIEKLRVNME